MSNIESVQIACSIFKNQLCPCANKIGKRPFPSIYHWSVSQNLWSVVVVIPKLEKLSNRNHSYFISSTEFYSSTVPILLSSPLIVTPGSQSSGSRRAPCFDRPPPQPPPLPAIGIGPVAALRPGEPVAPVAALRRRSGAMG